MYILFLAVELTTTIVLIFGSLRERNVQKEKLPKLFSVVLNTVFCMFSMFTAVWIYIESFTRFTRMSAVFLLHVQIKLARL
jgi:hypothetical protein